MEVTGVNNVSYVNYTGRDDRKVSATEVGVATGATVGGAKYSINAFKRFNLGKKLGQTTTTIREAATASTEVSSLWKRMFANAKEYKEAFINWCKTSKAGKALKPVFESKPFAKVSGLLGGAVAMFVFISGIGEMADTYSKIADAKN